MNKNNISAIIIFLGFLISGSIIGTATAQTEKLLQPQEQKMPGDMKFPISELGSCKSKEDCKVFCNDSKNTKACLKFAEKHNLMSSDELAMAKKFTDAGMIGPGQCKGKNECDAYCSNPNNLEECVVFAQKNGMMSEEKLQESQKVLAAIKKGIKPPSCGGPEDCDKYCSSSEHMEECMTFSIEAGIMDPQKQEQSKKILAAIKRGVKPPACKGQKECDTYCSSSEHMEECLNFSIETGMMSSQEKEQAQKTLVAMKQGIKPPACKGEQECQKYCAEDVHVEECVKFAVATGNMSEKDAKMAIKTGGKGPAGCAGSDCKTYCENPDNQEVCYNFAKENGMISEDQLQQMEESQQKMKDSFSQIPQVVLDCLTSSVGADVVEKMKNGAMIQQKSGEAINQCFQKVEGQRSNEQGQNNQPNMPADLRECLESQFGKDNLAKIESGKVNDPTFAEKSKICFDKYGQQNQQGQFVQTGQMGENFQPGQNIINPGNLQVPQQAGLVGCKSPEECQAYCVSNPDKCGGGGGGQAPGVNRSLQQFAPGTQMDQTGSSSINFEYKNPNLFQVMQTPIQTQNSPATYPVGSIPMPNHQPGQFIQAQPNQPLPSNNPTVQMAPQGPAISPEQPPLPLNQITPAPGEGQFLPPQLPGGPMTPPLESIKSLPPSFPLPQQTQTI